MTKPAPEAEWSCPRNEVPITARPVSRSCGAGRSPRADERSDPPPPNHPSPQVLLACLHDGRTVYYMIGVDVITRLAYQVVENGLGIVSADVGPASSQVAGSDRCCQCSPPSRSSDLNWRRLSMGDCQWTRRLPSRTGANGGRVPRPLARRGCVRRVPVRRCRTPRAPIPESRERYEPLPPP